MKKQKEQIITPRISTHLREKNREKTISDKNDEEKSISVRTKTLSKDKSVQY